MAVTGSRQRPLFGHTGFLRQARQCVVLAQNGDHRAVLPGLAHDGGRDAGDILRHLETLRVQHRRVLGAGLEFAVAEFRGAPDAVGQSDELFLMGVDPAPDFLGVLHGSGSD